uniref:Uncharacterized protein n=1 Tax=Rhizophagus irregularis (strain DAOM 181602 / DAOM 197198 / MUCL 43194) TaxID=747089 RepID=U9U7Q4_RHIID
MTRHLDNPNFSLQTKAKGTCRSVCHFDRRLVKLYVQKCYTSRISEDTILSHSTSLRKSIVGEHLY